jgi:hypothetical protein
MLERPTERRPRGKISTAWRPAVPQIRTASATMMPRAATVPTVWAVGPSGRSRLTNTRSTTRPRAAPKAIPTGKATAVGRPWRTSS